MDLQLASEVGASCGTEFSTHGTGHSQVDSFRTEVNL